MLCWREIYEVVTELDYAPPLHLSCALLSQSWNARLVLYASLLDYQLPYSPPALRLYLPVVNCASRPACPPTHATVSIFPPSRRSTSMAATIFRRTKISLRRRDPIPGNIAPLRALLSLSIGS